MRTSGYIASVVKETRLLTRDLHGLALLFLLPTVFILIMSLALQDRFDAGAGRGIEVIILDLDSTATSRDYIERISSNLAFNVVEHPHGAGRDELLELARSGAIRFGVVVPAGYEAAIDRALSPAALQEEGRETAATEIEAIIAADADRRMEQIFISLLREGIGRQQADRMLDRLRPQQPGEERRAGAREGAGVAIHYAFDANNVETPPSAVQQSVPAWLVFSIFFVAIPFSNTFIRERELGVLRRLRTTQMSSLSHVLGKLTPFFVVNQVQVALMLAVGVWIVPLLGGDALKLRGDPVALALMGASVSIAALGLALLISVLAATTEQATMLSGLGNILLAAIGGVMVPRFLMPETMQQLSELSPLAWGLDGFLHLLLQDGSITGMIREAAKLVTLGAGATVLALVLQKRQE